VRGKPVVGATSVTFSVVIPGDGTLDVGATGGGKSLGSARIKRTAAGAVTVKFPLSKIAQALRGKRAMRATFTFAFRPASGGATQRRTVSVTPPRRR
jgi:hypothetical protein